MPMLHHYPMSPFSEKIRLVFGYLDLEWQSVVTSESPPRPVLDQLTGGYRRIPVVQWGADCFCDSRLICSELAARAGRPELDPNSLDAAAQAYSEHLEGEVFWAAVAAIPVRRILGKLFRELSFFDALRFIRDRAGIARSAHSKPMAPQRAIVVFAEHLLELEQRLAAEGGYLAGEGPGYLDFAAYHTLWFQREVGGLPAADELAAVLAWYQRMTAIGHGRMHACTAESALQAARSCAPCALTGPVCGDLLAGSLVTVRPLDYALDGTTGRLLVHDQQRIVVARETPELGPLQVHFPTAGFEVLPAS